MDESEVAQLFEWYQSIERRLAPILEVLPFAHAADLERTVTPRAVPILVEAASIVDSLLRDLFPDEAKRPNGKKITRRGANFEDYRRELELRLHLSEASTLVMCTSPFILTPFEGWAPADPRPTRWWTAYNRLKHERLRWPREATMYNTIQALCGLHQLMTRIPEVVALAFRFGWLELSGYNPEVLLEGLPGAISGELSEFLSFTNHFCTPLSAVDWVDVSRIRPGVYKNSTRLVHFLGRWMTGS